MNSKRKRIAVVGAGVSGLGAAWALRESADVTVYERAARIGGHAWTMDIDYRGAPLAVDIGFICYNEPNYPNLTALLGHLGVATVATDMSFAVSDPKGYEWGSDPLGLFAWKRNLADPKFIGLLREILRFNTLARGHLAAGTIPDVSLGVYLDKHGFSSSFREGYLLPMGGAIWSTPEAAMLDYPVGSLIQFFDNHRLMHALRPVWRTVAGGSRTYVDRLARDLSGALRPGARIEAIRPVGGRVQIASKTGETETFDSVILAAHANDTLSMLDRRYEDHRLALGSVRFSSNTAWLHRDPTLMPKRRAAWASWNVLKGDGGRVCVTYWMNRLQKIQSDKPVFVTLNPTVEPAAEKTFGVHEFEHPIYDAPSAAARQTIQRLQGRDGLYVSGAWLGDGFHEAGLRTGLEAALALGGSVPWEAALQHRHPAPFHSAGPAYAEAIAQ
ncbi:MAG: FAD-dependent oxidoreductase [Alphaproteobacteria bacterium]|nr:FAD-dependent oxidoreductase [Alphaproteobacteria bacterium]